MKIAIVCSNYFNIRKETANGTAIFDYSLITQLVKHAQSENITITAFASGNSELPVKTISIDKNPSSANEDLLASGKNVLYELTLLSKAFSMQDQFDLYHINIGDGDLALPFYPFVKKPMLITIHHILDAEYIRKYFSLYKQSPNVFFISASNAQRKLLPSLNYLTAIYHGIDTKVFQFNSTGGESIMWAGRAIPEKGIDIVVEVADRVKHEAKLFGIQRKEHQVWLQKTVLNKINVANRPVPISLEMGLQRLQLVEHFQTSKLFLFPVGYEESFGLVLIEAMSCGTPVVAYAKGSIPEIIKDGVTGFIVNSSDEDIRGDWIIKKTGVEGLIEAVERIYSMSENKSLAMRKACREEVKKRFTIEEMVENYIKAYKTVSEARS
ncbi:MAG: glycosyltransferase [Candidatus Curtissbacteria bacterium]|nr:glycosyltransferase [Candidatus Curtissbacteria bacterium]